MTGSSDPTPLRALERGLAKLRWFGVVFGLFQVSQLTAGELDPSRPVIVLSYVTIAMLAIGNVVVQRRVARADDPRALRRIGLSAFALDAVVIFANVWLGSYDRNGAGWVLAYVLPLEGAIRYQLRGATVSIAMFSASELGREVYRLSLFSDLDFEISSVTFRVGVFAIIACVAGMMARSLHRQREQAESHARELSVIVDREAAGRAELQALHDVVLAGLEGGPFGETMDGIVDSVVGLFGYETFAIRVVEAGPGGAVVRCVACRGFPDDPVGSSIPAGQDVAGRAIATGRPQLVDDVALDPDHVEWVPGGRSVMVVPMGDRRGVIGVVEVHASEPGRFTRNDLARLERLSSQIGLVVTNARLLAQERATVERLRELDAMKSDFIAVTSHELRTPLTSVKGFVKTLRRPNISLSSTEIQELLAIVDRQADRLTRLVEDLLLTARIEAKTIDLHFDSVDVASALAEALSDLEHGRERVQLVVEPDLPSMVTDGHRLGQIARNLIENALKFSPDETPVRVTALREGSGLLLLEVADHGTGIPAEELPQVFERFHQVGDPLQRGTNGLGLGLYIVRNLVDALNGSIEVRSVIGEGTTFQVRLPLVPAVRADAEGA